METTTETQNPETKTTPEAKTTQQELKDLGTYVREVSAQLPKETFKREPTRLKYGILYWGGASAIAFSVVNYDMPWFLKAVLGVFMGILLGGGAFLGHEVLHGAIIKNKKWQDVFGFLGFAPFLISPTYWKFWHNGLHHGNTQLLYKDPDAFPTRMVWKKSKFMQRVFPLTPGAGTIRSYFYFFYWFSFQAVLNQAYMRFGNKMWSRMNHGRVTVEFIFNLILMGLYLNYIGTANLIWLLVLPVMAQNYTVMSYISTNHNISPYTKINDPLVNSLTVTNNPIMEFLNLNFGYHTEHHLFPAMPASQAKKVSAKLKEMYPDRYKIMPKSKALKILYSTPRIYKNRDILVDPKTGEEFATLGREHMLN